uniref:Uncharacterized protein n=1 Tax=Dulem virus 42 TaxID=3145760 RepID=A0AAU8BAQ4_9CAUD
MDALIFQLYTLDAFEKLSMYTDALSDLVNCSSIDTKKFGNNIASQFNFENRMMTFRCQQQVFTINT